MTTERQKRANAKNAAKSTGPRTPEGRAASSGNARKHGLSSAPPWDEVGPYLALITGSSESDRLALDARSQAALVLAEAEARLARCLLAERRQLTRMAEMAARKRLTMAQDAAKQADRSESSVAPAEWQTATGYNLKSDSPKKGRPPPDPDQPAALHQTLKTFTRYRREAEAQRRTALRGWLAIQRVDDGTNEEKLAYL